jgi:hypothetical protein
MTHCFENCYVARQKAGAGVALLVGKHLDISGARIVVDGDRDTLQVVRALAPMMVVMRWPVWANRPNFIMSKWTRSPKRTLS